MRSTAAGSWTSARPAHSAKAARSRGYAVTVAGEAAVSEDSNRSKCHAIALYGNGMALRSPADYRAALDDGRRLHYRGRPVEHINDVPDLRVAVDHAAIDYELAEDPEHRDLAVVTDPDTGEEHSAFYRIPRSADDLLHRSRLIEATTAAGGTVVTLIKEIGTDGMFAMMRVLQGEAREKAVAFYEHCRDGD